MAANLNKPHRWKADIAESVRTYNGWFLASAPKAFREQRETATQQVRAAMANTNNLTSIDAATLEKHPEILASLRMATSPPLARERLVGLASTKRAQEKRQLDCIADWLSRRKYRRIPPGDPSDPTSMPPGTYAFRMNVEGWVDHHGDKTVRIPVDIVVKSRHAAPGELPIFVEAKSAGDFTNVNKRRKEEPRRRVS